MYDSVLIFENTSQRKPVFWHISLSAAQCCSTEKLFQVSQNVQESPKSFCQKQSLEGNLRKAVLTNFVEKHFVAASFSKTVSYRPTT